MLVLAVVSLSVPLALRFSARVNQEVKSEASDEANLLEATAGHPLVQVTAANRRELALLAKNDAASIVGRVTVVDRSGVVLADSGDASAIGTNYATAGRPEFAAALGGRRYQAERPSQLLKQVPQRRAAQGRAARRGAGCSPPAPGGVGPEDAERTGA